MPIIHPYEYSDENPMFQRQVCQVVQAVRTENYAQAAQELNALSVPAARAALRLAFRQLLSSGNDGADSSRMQLILHLLRTLPEQMQQCGQALSMFQVPALLQTLYDSRAAGHCRLADAEVRLAVMPILADLEGLTSAWAVSAAGLSPTEATANTARDGEAEKRSTNQQQSTLSQSRYSLSASSGYRAEQQSKQNNNNDENLDRQSERPSRLSIPAV
jgi:hypothetical protein